MNIFNDNLIQSARENEHFSKKMHIQAENIFQEVRKQQTTNIGFLAREGIENEENN